SSVVASTADWIATGENPGDSIGGSVAFAGDVNGDGYSDVIIGTAYDNRAYAFYGSSLGLSEGAPSVSASTADWIATGENTNDYFGYSVASAGDVNGDGYSDVIIGADRYNSDQGRAYVFYGSSLGLSEGASSVVASTADWIATGENTGDYFSNSVASAGDVNGDGYSDVIIGADYYFYPGRTYQGRAYAFYGSSSGLSAGASSVSASTADWTATGENTSDYFGYCVASAGDVNGDGYSDVIIGVPLYDLGGRVYAFYGNNGGGISLKPQQLKSDGTPMQLLGSSGSSSSFQITILGRSYLGRTKVKLEWEVKPVGTPFDMTGLGQSSSWIDTGVSGATITEPISGLDPDTAYHWRVRIIYFGNAGSSPWFHTANGANETAFRTSAPISQLTFTSLSQTLAAGVVSDIVTIQTQDDSGNPVNVSSNTTINLTSDSAQGKFYSDSAGESEITYVTIISGSNSANFYYKDTKAGTPTIGAAEDPSQGWVQGTQQQTINPGTATQFTISGGATQTAGAANALTITAKDTYGNTATSYTGNKSLTFSGATSIGVYTPTVTDKDGSAVGFGTAAIITFASGISTAGGSMVLYKAEDASITATATGMTTPTALSVSVTPAEADHLVFLQQPTNTVVNGIITPAVTVELRDEYNNVCTNAPATAVTISLTPSASSLSGTLTQNTALGTGIAAFDDLIIDKAGIGYTLKARSPGLGNVSSDTFNIFTSGISTWTGAVDTDWDNAGNWDSGVVPVSTDTVIIPNTSNEPELGADITIAGLTIESNASFSTKDHSLTITGDMVLEGTLNAGSSTINVTGNITAKSHGTIEGVSLNISAGGYIGTFSKPVYTDVSGSVIIHASGMLDNTSIALKGKGNYQVQGSVPGFIFFNGALQNTGQSSISSVLEQGTSVLYKGNLTIPSGLNINAFTTVQPQVIFLRKH
ncbi:MAG: FG-GAP-like repeat-containing protein, partial [Candidatus Omnitrophota bacterium]